MKKIMILLLVLLVLLSSVVLAKTTYFEFSPEPGNLFVAPGHSLSYQVNVKTNLKLTDNPYEIDDTVNFAITKKGVLTSTRTLSSGETLNVNVTVHETLGSSISTIVTVIGKSQSSLPQTTGDWVKNADLENSNKFDSYYEHPSWLFPGCSLNTKLTPSAIVAHKNIIYSIAIDGEKSSLSVVDPSNCDIDKYVINVKQPRNLLLTSDLLIASDSSSSGTGSVWFMFYDYVSKSFLFKSDSVSGALIGSFVEGNNLVVLTNAVLASIDINSGKTLWSVSSKSSFSKDFVFDSSSNSVIVISGSNIHSYDIFSGIENWFLPLTLTKKSKLFIENDYLYSNDDSSLFKINLVSGVLDHTYDLSSVGSFNKVYSVKGNLVYLDTISGSVHQLTSFDFVNLVQDNLVDTVANSLFFDSFGSSFYLKSTKLDSKDSLMYISQSNVISKLIDVPHSPVLIPIEDYLVITSSSGVISVLSEIMPQSSEDSSSWLTSRKDLASSANNVLLDTSNLNLDYSNAVSGKNLLVNSDGLVFTSDSSYIKIYNSDLSFNSEFQFTDVKNNRIPISNFVLTKDYIVLTGSNFVSLYDLSGTRIWINELGYAVKSLDVKNNILYLTYDTPKGNYISSYSLFSGFKLNSYSVKGGVDEVLFTDDSVFFLDSSYSSIYKTDLSLNKIWAHTLTVNPGFVISDIMYDSSLDLLFVAKGDVFSSLDGSTGKEVVLSTYVSQLSNLAIFDSLIAFQEGDFYIDLFDPSSNSVVCSFVSPTTISSKFSSSSNELIFGSTNSYDFIDSSCSLKHSLDSVGLFSFEPVVTDDSLFLSSKMLIEKYSPIVEVVQSVKDKEFSVSVVPGCAGGDTSFIIYDEDSEPVSGANVHLISEVGSFNVLSDEDGLAKIFLPKSSYVLDVTARGYERATGNFDVVTCSARSSAETEEQISAIVERFSNSQNVEGANTINIPGSIFEFSTFSSGPSDVVEEEVEVSTKSIFDNSGESVFMFKSATAFSLFMLLLIILLIVIGLYVKHKVAAIKAFKHLEDEVVEEVEEVEKDVVDEVKHLEDEVQHVFKK